MSRRTELSMFVALALSLATSIARADGSKSTPQDETPRSDDRVHARFGVRFPILLRPDGGYFTDARVFAESPSVTTSTAHLAGDPIPPAVGIALEAGAELLPRLSLMGSFRTMTNGIQTGDDMRLSLNTQAWVLDARYAVLRATASDDEKSPILIGQIELLAGVGTYRLAEKFIDRALFDGTLENVSSGLGGRFGVDATVYLMGIGLVAGYAYDLTNVSISDRLGGSVKAGGHDITFGFAFRL